MYLYFAEKNPEFAESNRYINSLSSLIHKYDKMKKPSFLYIQKDTRFEETKMSRDFNEDTVYLSFMKYCLYNTGLDVQMNINSCVLNRVLIVWKMIWIPD